MIVGLKADLADGIKSEVEEVPRGPSWALNPISSGSVLNCSGSTERNRNEI